MKKHTKHTLFLATLMIMTTILGGCAGCNNNEIPTTPTVTITPTITPTEVPVIKPTVTVAVTPTIEPTVTPVPTNTPTPEPTNTPIPTVTVPDEKPVITVKMGDNVWYDYYENGTLIVRGSGVTYDFDATERYNSLVLTEDDGITVTNVFSIIIEEGITEIGTFALAYYAHVQSVSLPNTLTCIKDGAFINAGLNAENTEWINLDISNLEIAATAFLYSNGIDAIEGLDKYTATPTPVPTATPTPLPDKNNPRKVATKQMGDNVTFEFWDNGYLYVKGSGATWDYEYTFMDFWDEPHSNTTTVIVEEGITRLGDFVFNGLFQVTYYKLPKTLTSAGNTWGTSGGAPTTMNGYYDGKSVTVNVTNTSNPEFFFRILENPDWYNLDRGYEVIYHE